MADLFPSLPAHTPAYREGIARQLRALVQELEDAADDADATNPNGSLARAFARVMSTLGVPVDTWVSLAKPGSDTPGLLLFWVANVNNTLSQVDTLGGNLAAMIGAVTETLSVGARSDPKYRQARDAILAHPVPSSEEHPNPLSPILAWPGVGASWRAARHREKLEEAYPSPVSQRNVPRM